MSRMSSTGRKACARAGSRNLENWRNRRNEVTRERTALANQFRNELLTELGPHVTATLRALVESATASYIAIAISSTRFQQGRTNSHMMSELIRTQGQLNRTLKLLGLKFPIRNHDDSEAPPRGGIADYMRLRSEPEPEVVDD